MAACGSGGGGRVERAGGGGEAGPRWGHCVWVADLRCSSGAGSSGGREVATLVESAPWTWRSAAQPAQGLVGLGDSDIFVPTS